jgi:hypothetical protein
MNFTKNPANFSDTEKLLYLILQEIQKPKEPPAKQPAPQAESKKPKVTCKRCKQTFDGHGEFLKHAKACKKEATK